MITYADVPISFPDGFLLLRKYKSGKTKHTYQFIFRRTLHVSEFRKRESLHVFDGKLQNEAIYGFSNEFKNWVAENKIIEIEGITYSLIIKQDTLARSSWNCETLHLEIV